MAFKRTLTATFSVPVTVNVANEKGGYDKNTFTAKFERTETEALEELRGMKNEDLVRKKLKGWELIDDESKDSLPFTPENLDSILSISPTPLAIAMAFWEGVNGARVKN